MLDWWDWEVLFNRRFEKFVERESHTLERPSLTGDSSRHVLPTETHNPSQVGVGSHFLLSGEGWYLPIEMLYRLPRYLCAMTTLSYMNPVYQAHYEYWRYTGAYASAIDRYTSPVRSQPIPSSEMEDPEPYSTWSTIPMTPLELNDLCLLLWIGILGLQKKKVPFYETHTGVIPTDNQPLPNFYRLIDNSFNLTSRYGFPVLEGMAGKWKQESSSNFQNKLEDWTRNTEKELVRATLLEINNLTAIDTERDILSQMYDIISQYQQDTAGAFKKESIFYQLKKARVGSQHGNDSYSVPAVIIVTLSCLAFWNLLTNSQYETLREWIKQDIRRRSDKSYDMIDYKKWMIEDFYNSTITPIRRFH